MIRLLQIELKKQVNYRAFWVLLGLYTLVVGLTLSSGMIFLSWVKSKGGDFSGIDPMKIPLYHFPDVWQNLTYIATYFHIIPGILMVMSITNEFSYKTIRQNVIDGLSRTEFLLSKLSLALLISLGSTLFISLFVIITGSIYSPEGTWEYFFRYTEFVPGFFLNTFTFLCYAFLLGLLVRKAGLSIALLIFIFPIEYIFTANLPDSMDAIKDYFPMHALNNLVTNPFGKYIFIEIRDYISLDSLVASLVYLAGFIGVSWLKLQKSDL
jgi:ABC-2 type transport system permease protein